MLPFNAQQRPAEQALLHVHETLPWAVNVAVVNEEAPIDRCGPCEFVHRATLRAGASTHQGAMARLPAATWPYSAETTRRMVSP